MENFNFNERFEFHTSNMRKEGITESKIAEHVKNRIALDFLFEMEIKDPTQFENLRMAMNEMYNLGQKSKHMIN